MKKLLLITFSLLSFTVLNGQITILHADMPNAGDSILTSITNTIGTLDQTLTGANYNWDYSTLVYQSQQEVKFDAPSSFPLLFAVLFNGFNTSYGRENRNLTTIPGANVTAAYDFLKETNTALKQVGGGMTVNGTPIPYFYSPNDIIYTFPMNYLNTDSCNYSYNLTIPTIGYYGETGHRVNVVDGWGTLITPGGTYQTLRVKSVITSIDTLYNSTFMFGITIPRPARVEYKWLATAKQIPVLEIDATTTGTTQTITNVQYQDTLHPTSGVGIKENTLNNFNASIFPNPCEDVAILQYNLTVASRIKISVSDVLGRTISTLVDESETASIHLKTIDVKELHLTKGIYFVNIQSGTTNEVKKLVVE